jgi:SAM-dependent methyltransferase
MSVVTPILNPTKRFSNRVENYARYRPGYPKEIITFFEEKLGLTKNKLIADIGSGTGLFAEPLLKAGYSVIGIEPNKEMQEAGAKLLKNYQAFNSYSASAEATGLAPESVDLITVAQAFHWFDPILAKEEFKRVLKPGAHVVLAWNIQKSGTPFMDSYMALKEKYCVEAMIPERIDEQKIAAFFAPASYERIVFPNIQLLDFDALKGQLLSSSYIPLPGHERYDDMISELVNLFVNHNESGNIRMQFETIVFSS